METVSVDKAIRVGRRKVNLTTGAIFLCAIVFAIVMQIVSSVVYWFPLAFLGGAAVSLLYRAVAVVKWRIWAFENVRNVHELKRQALISNLVVEDNNILLKKLEISTAAQQERWLQLEQKFTQQDVFTDDYDVPAETVVYFSVWKKLIFLLLFVPLTIVGIGLLVMGGAVILYVGGVLIFSLGSIMSVIFIKNALDKTPQLILNSEGLTTLRNVFYKWEDIEYARTEVRGTGKQATLNLVCGTPYGEMVVHLDGFTVSRSRLEHLLMIYSGRNKLSRKR